ncbi:shikimate kinase [Natronospora cellulosivora (SeqCode)]
MNLVLIGMSGAGKSTLGVLLAKSLALEFIDTDIIIQKAEARLLQDIIYQVGVEAFLKIEEKVVSNLKKDNAVIATGGSVVYSPVTMESLKSNAKIIYLYVSFEEIKKRINNINSRGIAMKKGYNLKDVYNERIPLYERYADIIVDCSNKSIEQSLDEILLNLNV